MGQILWVGKNYLLPKAGVKRHTHPYYHMFYMIAGSCSFTLAQEHRVLRQGQCLLVPPEAEHGYCNESDENAGYYELKFSFRQSSAHKQLSREITVMDSPLVGSLLEQILVEYAGLGSVADEAAAAYLDAILSLLTLPQRTEKPRRFRYFDANGASELAQRIVRYLETHYASDLMLDDLAAATGYNKSYLCVAFKKDMGLTILDCLNTIRIRSAAELIVYSDQPLAQVAEQCGFASVSHFNRVFLKYVGATPGQCRRAYPVDVLFQPAKDAVGDRPNAFMYSVLAQKQITSDMVRKLDDYRDDQ